MKEVNKNIGINKTASGFGQAGIGYVVIPEDLGREEYIQNCLRSARLTMWGGDEYGRFRNVPVAKGLIQEIEFPMEADLYGSVVFWIKDNQTGLPVITTILEKESDFQEYFDQVVRKIYKFENNVISITFDKNQNLFGIDVLSTGLSDSAMNIKLGSKTTESVFNLLCDGYLNLESAKEVNVKTKGKLSIIFNDENEEQQMAFVYERGTGLTYVDEFKNTLVISSNKTEYEDQFGNKLTLEDGKMTVISKEINHNSGAEPMVLGDTLQGLLEDMLSAITSITVPTALGPSGTPINTPQFQAISGKLSTMLSKISNLE
jgi:hypothetical protein